MRSVLDEARYWQLQGVSYDGELRLVLAEMAVGEPGEAVVDPNPALQEILRGSRPIEVSEEGKVVELRFSRPVAWQIVDESYTVWDDYEKRDDRCRLQILSRSRYFDYVNANHGWYSDMIGPAKHYRVWTGDDVADVVSTDPPLVQVRKPGT